MKAEHYIALGVIVFISATAANLITAYIIAQQIKQQAGNTTVGSLLSAIASKTGG